MIQFKKLSSLYHACCFTRLKKLILIILVFCFAINVILILRIPQRQKEIDTQYLEDRTSSLLETPETEPFFSKSQSEPESQTQYEDDTIKTELFRSGQSACPKMTIHRQEEIDYFSNNTKCRPHLPSEDACEYTADLFTQMPEIVTCHDQEEPPYELCKISEVYRKARPSTFNVRCDLSPCSRRRTIRLKIVNPSDGYMFVQNLPGSTSNSHMQLAVEDAARKTRENGFNFLFMTCSGRKHGKNISQLLTVLPPESIFKRQVKSSIEKVNVNIVLLDSISRPHFYRSLPKTVDHLRRKQYDPNYKAHIFDFELFQSVHGHTHENEHALFSGALFPENYTKSDKEDASTNMEVLFGIFKRAGYQTMLNNDLCWKARYGIMDSLKVSEWEALQPKIKEANIDSTGITDASCEILDGYQKTTAFQDAEDHQICFNGKHHHRYLFDYLTHYLETIGRRSQSKPLFSYTETNVAHDDIGVRVQTLDRDLTDLIDAVANEPNTITIIVADHGNTYTDYQVRMLEGRFEMYHPILLTVLPKQLGEKFGQDIVSNLKTNQYRLLNLFDIRAGLVELANYDTRSKLKPVGIFKAISEKRTCDDLQLSTPNFCLCEGWDIAVENSTAQMALAEFGIGQLNNQIQESLLASRAVGKPLGERLALFGACQRLRIERIDNVRQRQTAKGTQVTTIDVKVQSGNIVDQEELITLQVELNQKTDTSSFEMKLVSYNRISQYGFYKQCADPGVNLKLCVCDKPETGAKGKGNGPSLYDNVSKSSKFRKLKPCLFLIKRTYKENIGEENFVGVEVYEIANVCSDQLFKVTFSAQTDNVRPSTDLPMVLRLKAKSVYFVSVMMTEVGYYPAELKLYFRIVKEDEKRKSRKRKKRKMRKRKKSRKSI